MSRGIGISAVRAFISSGGCGTVEEIAETLGVKTSTTYWCLRTLRAHREADRIGTRPSAGTLDFAIWGAWQGGEEEDVVSIALGARPAIEIAWATIAHPAVVEEFTL